jgi:hypothetical protein
MKLGMLDEGTRLVVIVFLVRGYISITPVPRMLHTSSHQLYQFITTPTFRRLQ